MAIPELSFYLCFCSQLSLSLQFKINDMHRSIYWLCLFLFSGLRFFDATGQELPNPFQHPILLSGSFGELRSNHFHSGIDFKTQGVEGKPIHAVKEGYVSRISVSPGGYGNALYLDHPDGTTTVYGHLLSYSAPIAAYIKEQQYLNESFIVNLYPEPDLFPVKKGEVIALSGNTGSSGGPHLHFEVRDTKSGDVLDPLLYYMDQIKDATPPRIQGIMLYPVEGEGVVNGKGRKQEFKQLTGKGNRYNMNGNLSAWGMVGVGIKAYDYMDNTHNIYGVKEIVLKVDGETVYRSNINRFPISDTRYLNSFVDYADWMDNRSFYMKSFVEPGNKLPFIESKARGYITIDEERDYRFEYILTDAFGNSAYLDFVIQGKEQPITTPDTEGREPFSWRSDNKFGKKGIRLTIPKGNLYDSFYFKYNVKEDSLALAGLHTLHNEPIPLHRNAELSLRLINDPLKDKTKYGIVRINKGRRSWVGGVYRNGWIDATIRDLGQYSLAMDTIAPAILPVEQATWKSKQQFAFRLTDNLSGVKSYRGEIDGEFALFERNNRSVITYHFDKDRLQRGEHTLRLIVEDACGNEAVYTHSFVW